MEGRKRTTIKDIARKLNLAHSTVSRAFNNSPGVNEKTKRKIHKLAKKLNYRPNTLARGLVSKPTNTIGLILSQVGSSGLSNIIRGVESWGNRNDHSVILCFSENDPDLERKQIQVLLDKCVDGIILLSCWGSHTVASLKRLKKRNVPLVLVDRYFEEIDTDYVIPDDVNGAYKAVEYLIRLEHRRIGCISFTFKGSEECSSVRDRIRGYKKALRKYNLKFEENLLKKGDSKETRSINVGYQKMKEFLRMEERPTAVFSVADLPAIGALRAIQEDGLRVPQDISLVGFTNLEISAFSNPSLTTVGCSDYKMGEMATKLLLDRIKKNVEEEPQQVVLKTNLIERESCGPAPRELVHNPQQLEEEIQL